MRARGWMRLTSSAGVIALASLARADAPTDQYYFFSQTDLVIEDLRTNLTWQRYASPATVSWDASFGVCASLAPDHGKVWRVPSHKELLTLVDESPHYEYQGGALIQHWIDPNAFPQALVDEPYLSSSPAATQPPGAVYAVNFHTGAAQFLDHITPAYVRCVHD